jgi:Zn-dependent metalloprotease
MKFSSSCALLLVVGACSTDIAFAKNDSVRGSSNGQGNGPGNSSQQGGGASEGNANNNGQGHAYGRDRNTIGRVSNGREKADSKGNKHQRFQVTVDSIPVFGHHEVVHKNQGNGRERITKDVMPGFVDIDPVATVSESDAESTAIAYVSANHVGAVNVVSNEINIYILGDVSHLVYTVQTEKLDSGTLISMPLVFVDAHENRVLDSFETLDSAQLRDSSKVTFNGELNNNNIGDSSDSVLSDIHSHVQTTLDFLIQPKYGLDSYDGNGAQVLSVGHYRDNYVNAFWTGSWFGYGDGDGRVSAPLGVLDIVAHEIGHAVTQFSSGLIYRDESGALNEGASDIMGAVVEAFVDNQVNADTWKLGEDAWLARDALRYMNRPSTDGSSRDHYSNRYIGTADSGGVHWNSGILNHWFYLLVVGGQHHNPSFRTGTVINGIGVEDAFEIWFQAWTNELTPSSTFDAARVATLTVCADLGFDPQTTCASVQNAWAEVGLGEVYVPSTPPTNGCAAGEISVQLDITTDQWGALDNSLFLTSGNDEIKWSFPDLAASTTYPTFTACLDSSQCSVLRFIDTYGDGCVFFSPIAFLAAIFMVPCFFSNHPFSSILVAPCCTYQIDL